MSAIRASRTKAYCTDTAHRFNRYLPDSATQDFTLYLYNTSTPKSEKWRRLRGGGTQVVTGGHPGVVNDSDHDTDDDDGDWRLGGRWQNRGPNQATSMHKIKAVRGHPGRWTITDADADRRGDRMIYSSITPYVHMLRTDEHDTDHQTLDFRDRGDDHFGVGAHHTPRLTVDLEYSLLSRRQRSSCGCEQREYHGL